jgi:hypothetical protein
MAPEMETLSFNLFMSYGRYNAFLETDERRKLGEALWEALPPDWRAGPGFVAFRVVNLEGRSETNRVNTTLAIWDLRDLARTAARVIDAPFDPWWLDVAEIPTSVGRVLRLRYT